jgi:hypothetical protein
MLAASLRFKSAKKLFDVLPALSRLTHIPARGHYIFLPSGGEHPLGRPSF